MLYTINVIYTAYRCVNAFDKTNKYKSVMDVPFVVIDIEKIIHILNKSTDTSSITRTIMPVKYKST